MFFPKAAGHLCPTADPTAVCKLPEDALKREDLSDEQKAAILRRCAYDARELEVAEDEGMRDGEPDLLDRVLRALEKLKAASSTR
jgi:hypothetical protein